MWEYDLIKKISDKSFCDDCLKKKCTINSDEAELSMAPDEYQEQILDKNGELIENILLSNSNNILKVTLCLYLTTTVGG